ncbi:MAG: arginine--tRNA ligase [Bacillota bacterium]
MQGQNTIIGKRKQIIKDLIVNALIAAKQEELLLFEGCPDFTVEVPRETSHGDFATNIAMLLSKQCKKSPRDIAAIIIDKFPQNELVKKTEMAGPGFINFHLTDDWLNVCLGEILLQKDNYGRSDFGQGKKVQVEFVSANPTGELHMGNARGAAIGDTLASLLTLAGYEVQREFYINDAGAQIEKFALSLEARYFQALGDDVEFPEDGYHGQDIINTIQELVQKEGDKYKNMDAILRRELLTNYALDKKISSIKKTLADFGVHYDVWFSEQSLHDSGAVTDIIQKLQDSEYLYEKEGAIWFDCKRFGQEKDEVLVRSNGVPTYFAADIAYHNNKLLRGFDQVIDIWGADHHGHVARMKEAMSALGYDPARLEVILMQLVRLYQDGEILRMSKRTGTYITLAELMEDIGKDAARFFFVMRSADSQMDFDLDLAKKQSSDNPVYYVQYAFARICSMLDTARKEGYEWRPVAECNLQLLNHPSELALIRKMADFPDEIIYAAKNYEPHRLAIYVQELAALFHNFYTHCRILVEDKELAEARIWLSQGVAGIIKTSLNTMGVTAPEKM